MSEADLLKLMQVINENVSNLQRLHFENVARLNDLEKLADRLMARVSALEGKL